MAAVSGVDMWFLNEASVFTAQSNLSIWLSVTPTYNTPNGSYQCVNDFSPTVFAPAKHTIACAQTLSATRYVTVGSVMAAIDRGGPSKPNRAWWPGRPGGAVA